MRLDPGGLSSQLRSQLQRSLATIIVVWTASAGVLSFVVLLHWAGGVKFGYLTRDPAAIAGTGPFIGFLSNLGIVLWTAAAALCLFSATVMERRRGSERLRSFLLSSGLLTTLLMLDDLYMFHEITLYFLRMPEEVVASVYGVLVLAGLVVFARTVLQTEFLLLGMALGFLGLSVAVDVLVPYSDRAVFVEDGFKFMGIASWLAYFARVAAAAVRPAPERSDASPSSSGTHAGAPLLLQDHD